MEQAPRSNGVAINVAPLNLPGIDDACYDLRVAAATGTVWSEGNPAIKRSASPSDGGAICASSYGNAAGGDITYVGSCSADPLDDTNPAVSGVQNVVTLWVDGLYTVASGVYTDTGDWQNPCASGCPLEVTCAENADTPVDFNLTIMRRARQGFFDLAINFEDVFCSAKVDCLESPQGLVFNNGERDDTVVIARACTAGVGAATRRLLSATEIYCVDAGGTTQYGPLDAFNAGSDGNQGDPAGPLLFQNAIYSGYEQLTDGGTPAKNLGKIYVNQAIGVDVPPNADCYVRGYFTVYDANVGLPADPAGAGFGTYPAVYFDVKVVSAGASGATQGVFGCTNNALDGTGSVDTVYVDLDSLNDVTVGSLPSGSFDGPSVSLNVTDCAQNLAPATTPLENCIPTGSKRVFITQNRTPPNVGGVVAADARCVKAASSAGLCGAGAVCPPDSWRAWIASSAADDPESRFTKSTQPYILLNGTVVANSWNDLVDGTVTQPINLSEVGNTVGWNVWTAVDELGQYDATYGSCSGWTSDASGDLGGIGSPGPYWTAIGGWALADGINCQEPAAHYCFEQ